MFLTSTPSSEVVPRCGQRKTGFGIRLGIISAPACGLWFRLAFSRHCQQTLLTLAVRVSFTYGYRMNRSWHYNRVFHLVKVNVPVIFGERRDEL